MLTRYLWIVLVLCATLSSCSTVRAQDPRPFTDQDKRQLITGVIIGLDMARAAQGLPNPITIPQAQAIIQTLERVTRGCTSFECMIDKIAPMVDEVRKQHRLQA